jgi:ribosomal peptide maturation radical SAM protein 1
MRDLQFNIDPGDAVIIVPPLASTTMPSLAAHLLQSCARKAGYNVKILYGNLLFASQIGQLNYEALFRGSLQYMLGERLFCSAAYGLPAFGRDNFLAQLKDARVTVSKNNIRAELEASDLAKWERNVHAWVEQVSCAVHERGFKVVGCTTTFEQTSASVALLNRIKQLSRRTVTILGGANCEGEMAEGIVSLGANVDYVFSGESETAFPKFLGRIASGDYPNGRIVRGEPCMDLDDVPAPEFTEFFEQRRHWLSRPELDDQKNLWVTYESSRGCWWGQKQHCTFCGLNGETMHFRQKSAQKLIEDIKALVNTCPTRRVCMTDNIIPHDYFRNFLPRAPEEIPGVTFFYEVKANLSLQKVMTLKQAGVKQLQPGIESLSTECLKLMKKGVSAQQNINLLRYARAIGVWLGWNILYALPGDKITEYQLTLKLIPLLHHLQPPLGLSHLSLERFSPYFMRPADYRIENIRPIGAYRAFLPERADLAKIAYHFEGDYESESRANICLVQELDAEVNRWQRAWESDEEIPCLAVSELNDDAYLLLDTRGVEETQEINFLNAAQARVALTGKAESRQDLEWALDKKIVVELDSRVVPLATAEPKLFQMFIDETAPGGPAAAAHPRPQTKRCELAL